MPDAVVLQDHAVPKAEGFKVGQTVSFTQVIDDKLVRGYADLTGDHNPIHVDEAFAKKTKFHQRIAHGGILFGIVSMVLGDKMPGIGTIFMSQLVNFHAPVFINDKVTVVVTITALLPKHVAKLSTIATKQDGTVVMDGVATIKLPGSLMLPVTTAAPKAA
jgi:acyl dehydratase